MAKEKVKKEKPVNEHPNKIGIKEAAGYTIAEAGNMFNLTYISSYLKVFMTDVLKIAPAKAGLMFGLTKSIAQFGSKYGIRCVCIAPGPVLTRAAMANMKTLLGRAAEPQEVVDLMLYLLSDKAAFITGTNYLIDGGRYCMGKA